MDEAKTLVQHFLSALFGVLVLAAVVALLTVGNLLWRALSRQDDANRTLKEYAKYSAFDGTTVRGQDVIALLHDTQGDPFVIITDKDYKPVLTAMNNVTKSFDASDYDDDAHDMGAQTLHTALINQNPTRLDCLGNSTAKHLIYMDGTTDDTTWYNPEYAKIQQWFLDRGQAASGVSGYLEYKSFVIYDGGSSATIVGFILVEQQGGGTP